MLSLRTYKKEATGVMNTHKCWRYGWTNTKPLPCFNPTAFREKSFCVGSKSLCVTRQINCIHRKHSNTAIQARLIWMKILHQLSIILCIISIKASATLHWHWHSKVFFRITEQTAMSCIHYKLFKFTKPPSVSLVSHEQSIPDLSSMFSVQMSIKMHLLYWGIPVKHHINVKVSNHLNHADFSKNTQLCATCQIMSPITVLSLWKWAPTVLVGLMIRPD